MERSLSESWDDESVGHDISDCFYFGKLYFMISPTYILYVFCPSLFGFIFFASSPVIFCCISFFAFDHYGWLVVSLHIERNCIAVAL